MENGLALFPGYGPRCRLCKGPAYTAEFCPLCAQFIKTIAPTVAKLTDLWKQGDTRMSGPFDAWLADRTQPVPNYHGEPDRVWLTAEPDGSVAVWCWPHTTGPDSSVARVAAEPDSPEYYEQMSHVLAEHQKTAHSAECTLNSAGHQEA